MLTSNVLILRNRSGIFLPNPFLHQLLTIFVINLLVGGCYIYFISASTCITPYAYPSFKRFYQQKLSLRGSENIIIFVNWCQCSSCLQFYTEIDSSTRLIVYIILNKDGINKKFEYEWNWYCCIELSWKYKFIIHTLHQCKQNFILQWMLSTQLHERWKTKLTHTNVNILLWNKATLSYWMRSMLEFMKDTAKCNRTNEIQLKEVSSSHYD